MQMQIFTEIMLPQMQKYIYFLNHPILLLLKTCLFIHAVIGRYIIRRQLMVCYLYRLSSDLLQVCNICKCGIIYVYSAYAAFSTN